MTAWGRADRFALQPRLPATFAPAGPALFSNFFCNRRTSRGTHLASNGQQLPDGETSK
jgi:hypothetical protein